MKSTPHNPPSLKENTSQPQRHSARLAIKRGREPTGGVLVASAAPAANGRGEKRVKAAAAAEVDVTVAMPRQVGARGRAATAAKPPQQARTLKVAALPRGRVSRGAVVESAQSAPRQVAQRRRGLVNQPLLPPRKPLRTQREAVVALDVVVAGGLSNASDSKLTRKVGARVVSDSRTLAVTTRLQPSLVQTPHDDTFVACVSGSDAGSLSPLTGAATRPSQQQHADSDGSHAGVGFESVGGPQALAVLPPAAASLCSHAAVTAVAPAFDSGESESGVKIAPEPADKYSSQDDEFDRLIRLFDEVHAKLDADPATNTSSSVEYFEKVHKEAHAILDRM